MTETTKKKGRPRTRPIIEKKPRGRPKTAIEKVKAVKTKKVKIKKRRVGRPTRTWEKQASVTLLLGIDYITLLNTISDKEQRNKSAIMRDLINMLAIRIGMQPEEYPYGEHGYRPSVAPTNNNATFTVGQAHVDLLQRIFDNADHTQWEAHEGGAVKFGKSQLVREELDRYAVEQGLDPINPVSEKVLA